MQSTINKWGNSLALRLPKAVADEANFREGTPVKLTVADGRLTVALALPKVTLKELLAQCDPDAPLCAEEREWLGAPDVGNEKV